MSLPTADGLTYDDLRSFPDDHLRRELISGELFVTPAPNLRHQHAVGEVFAHLRAHARLTGGRAFVAPTDVILAVDTVVEPDVLYVVPEHVHRLTERAVEGAPDLVVEVSSPTTRRLDLVKKLTLYGEQGVPEYWFVDLEAEVVDVFRLREQGGYAVPRTYGRDETVVSGVVTGLEVPVEDVLGDTPAEA